MHIVYGNYDSSFPPVPVAPRRIDQISTFTEDYSVSLTGSSTNFNVLNEFYCTTRAGVTSTKSEEVGFFGSLSDAGIVYFNNGAYVGTWYDGVRNWTVRSLREGSAGHFIMFYAGKQVLNARLDKKAALSWLVSKGQVNPTHYVNGTAIGVEPVRSSGSMTVANWSVTFR